MHALIVGAGGQLGRALQACAPDDWRVTALGSQDLDVTSAEAVHRAVEAAQPAILFNAAAYTAVDQAESEEARATAVNATAVGHLADAAQANGARLVQPSTDFVFDGAIGRPYRPDDDAHPLSAYGRSKLAGERAAGPSALIVRTAWLYGASGHNFVRTMLRLMRQRPEMRVVADQVGTPTWVEGLAEALWSLALGGASGIHHYTDAGVASWYDFAVAIQEDALDLRLIETEVPVVPVSSAEFPMPAPRPSWSVLDKATTWAALGHPAPHWRHNLRTVLRDLAEGPA